MWNYQTSKWPAVEVVDTIWIISFPLLIWNIHYYALKQVDQIIHHTFITAELEAAVYKTIIRPVLKCGSETWALRKAEQNLL